MARTYAYSADFDKEVESLFKDAKLLGEGHNGIVYEVPGNKAIKIRVYVEPRVPFEITNLYYFENTTKLQGANFEVTEVSGGDPEI